MNYGFYLSAGGVFNNMHRQDVLANNLANVRTAGFKPDSVYMRQRLPARVEAPQTYTDPQWMLERLGGGRLLEPTHTNFSQGGLESTGNDLDLAIDGEGFFMVASDGDGPIAERIAVTRDGRLTLNTAGQLITVAGGLPVLNGDQEPIEVDRTLPVEVRDNGEIVQAGEVVDRMALRLPQDLTSLHKLGDNLYRLDGPAAMMADAPGRVRQGYIEGSGVDPILALNAMIGASKSLGANAKLIQYHDHITGQAVSTLGRVA